MFASRFGPISRGLQLHVSRFLQSTAAFSPVPRSFSSRAHDSSHLHYTIVGGHSEEAGSHTSPLCKHHKTCFILHGLLGSGTNWLYASVRLSSL